jgi:deoxyribodipyrimidine photo-lyase
MRPRLQSRLPEFLIASTNPKAKVPWTPPPNLQSLSPDIDLTEGWPIDRSVQPVSLWKGGTREALRLLKHFVEHSLPRYSRDRNHPELDGTSHLSPYLHFGHINPVTVALAVQNAEAPQAVKDAFLNQVIIWRELSVNLVHFNPN